MSVTTEAAFTVLLRGRKWTVTCDRCGVDLSDDYSPSVTVIKVKNFDIMQVRSPDRAKAFVKNMGKLWDEAVSTGRPLICDADSISIEQTPTKVLESVIENHARECGT